MSKTKQGTEFIGIDNENQAKKAQPIRSTQDSPWKDLLGNYFRLFIAFFFPKIFPEIDWERGYEQLNTELANLKKGNITGRQLADKLIKVYLKSGKELWMLIHVEIQSSRQSKFAQRMYVYNYMISHKYKHDVVSLAVLTDGDAKFRPDKYEKKLWGCELTFKFPMVKLLDYRGKEAELEKDSNPFALVVLAHLKHLEFKPETEGTARLGWKLELMRLLARKGFTGEQEAKLFDFIDWLIALPENLVAEFETLLTADKEVQKMPYVTSIERVIEKRGIEQGIEKGRVEERTEIALRQLNRKLGQPLPSQIEAQVKQLSGDDLLTLTDALLDFNKLEDLTNWLDQHQSNS